jgi:rfaE bifunctional protein nucleotidyltransferase chain/domain
VKKTDQLPERIFTLPQLLKRVAQWRVLEKKIVFTNGVFDVLHPGHLQSLNDAASEGDYLVVGINSDSSVKRLKGADRPVYDQHARALILASLLVVDAVTIFEEDTPLELIISIQPDVLVKGGDYTVDQIAGAKEVMDKGGRVVIKPLLEGYSTTSIINKLKM